MRKSLGRSPRKREECSAKRKHSPSRANNVSLVSRPGGFDRRAEVGVRSGCGILCSCLGIASEFVERRGARGLTKALQPMKTRNSKFRSLVSSARARFHG